MKNWTTKVQISQLALVIFKTSNHNESQLNKQHTFLCVSYFKFCFLVSNHNIDFFPSQSMSLKGENTLIQHFKNKIFFSPYHVNISS